MGLVFLIWFAGIGLQLSKVLFVLGMIIGVTTFLIYGMRYVSWADSYVVDPEKKPNFTFTKKVLLSCVSAMVLSAMIPDQKTIYYMGGAYVGVKAVQSETGNKVVEMINKKIDQYITEMDQGVKVIGEEK